MPAESNPKVPKVGFGAGAGAGATASAGVATAAGRSDATLLHPANAVPAASMIIKRFISLSPKYKMAHLASPRANPSREGWNRKQLPASDILLRPTAEMDLSLRFA